jgi:hypothetical protein
LWPAEIPTGLQIVANESSVDDSGYILALETQPRSQQSASVRAGAPAQPQAQIAPERTTAVTVRGQPGQAFTTGAGYAISWEEDGVPYKVTGGGLDETLAFANSLEEVSGEVWQQRLAEAPQP